MSSEGADTVALTLDAENVDGLRMSLGDPSAATTAVGGGHGHASHLDDEEVDSGMLNVRLRGEWSSHSRHCLYWRRTCTLKIYRKADDALRDRAPEATVVVTIARARGPNELAVRTQEGETVLCVAATAALATRWVATFASAEASTLSAYIFVSRKKGWKRRWAVFQRRTHVLCLYQAREGDPTSSVAFYGQALDAKSRGSLTVLHAVKQPRPKLPFGFTCYSPDGQTMHLSADGPEGLESWLEAMPLLQERDAADAAAPRPAAARGSVVADLPMRPSGAHGAAAGAPRRVGLARKASSRLEGAMLEAMRDQVHKLRLQREETRISARLSQLGRSATQLGIEVIDESARQMLMAHKPPPPPPPPGSGGDGSGGGEAASAADDLVSAAALEALAASVGVPDGADNAPPPSAPLTGPLPGASAGSLLERGESMMSSRTEAEEELDEAQQLAEYAYAAAAAEVCQLEERDGTPMSPRTSPGRAPDEPPMSPQ